MYFLLTSSIFDIQKVKVANNSYYTAEQIISKAKVQTGKNIFGVKTDHMKERLLQDPYVRNVKIKRSLPGTLLIDVEERKEAAAIPFAESYILIDKDGMVLRKSNVEPKLTLLIGMTIKNMEPGKPLEVEENSVLTHTLYLLETMQNTDVFFKKIDISNVIIKAYIYDQLICQGTPENILENMNNGNLETILYELYAKGIERGIMNVGSDNYYSFNPMVE